MSTIRGISASSTAVLVIALSAVLVAVGMAIPAGIGRAIVVLPVAALAPGWALQTVAGRRGRGDVAVQLGLAVMLSMTLEIGVALALAATGVKLTAHVEAASLAGLLAILAAGAWWRSEVTATPGATRYWRPWLAAAALITVIGGTSAGVLAFSEHVGSRPLNDNTWTGLTLTGAAAGGQTLTTLPGDTVRLRAVLADNAGDGVDTTAMLAINGQVRARARVTLTNGHREYIDFAVPAPHKPGTYDIRIAANGRSVDAALEVAKP